MSEINVTTSELLMQSINVSNILPTLETGHRRDTLLETSNLLITLIAALEAGEEVTLKNETTTFYGVTWATAKEPVYQTGYVFKTVEEAENVALDGPWRTIQNGQFAVDHLAFVNNGDTIYARIDVLRGSQADYIKEIEVGEYIELNVGFISSGTPEEAVAEVSKVLEGHETFTWDNRDLVVDVSS